MEPSKTLLRKRVLQASIQVIPNPGPSRRDGSTPTTMDISTSLSSTTLCGTPPPNPIAVLRRLASIAIPVTTPGELTRFSATITTALSPICRRSPASARPSARGWVSPSPISTATVSWMSSSPTTACPTSCFIISEVGQAVVGDEDIHETVANDSLPNFLFHNLGGFQFREVGYEMGVALPETGRSIAGMGADFRDYDNDGHPELIVTAMVNDAFQIFRNLGGLKGFDDYTSRTGLASATRSLTGWATAFFDFDNDRSE